MRWLMKWSIYAGLALLSAVVWLIVAMLADVTNTGLLTACIVSGLVGGALAGRVVIEWIQRGAAPLILTFITISVVIVIPWIAVANGMPSAPGARARRAGPPPDKSAVLAKFFDGGAKLRGWTIKPDVRGVDYTLHSSGNPQVLYTGVDAVDQEEHPRRAEGARINIAYTADPLSYEMYYKWDEDAPWEYMHSQTPFEAHSHHRRLFLSGFATDKRYDKHNVHITIATTPPADRVPVRTECWAKPGHMLSWGALPKKDLYSWKLSVRFSDTNGLGLSTKDMADNPGQIIMGSDPTDFRDMVGVNERRVSSSEVVAPTELKIRVPEVGTEWVAVEVTLVVASPEN